MRAGEVLLVSAKLPGFSFRKETLRRVDLSGADVRKGDFRRRDEMLRYIEGPERDEIFATSLTVALSVIVVSASLLAFGSRFVPTKRG